MPPQSKHLEQEGCGFMNTTHIFGVLPEYVHTSPTQLIFGAGLRSWITNFYSSADRYIFCACRAGNWLSLTKFKRRGAPAAEDVSFQQRSDSVAAMRQVAVGLAIGVGVGAGGAYVYLAAKHPTYGRAAAETSESRAESR
eukprot:353839-Chlamydomonas_euryale.AAC.38